MSRPIPDAWFHRVKAATRDLVTACGGVERTANLASASKSEVSRWQVATSPDILPIAAALALEAECGVPHVTAVMAELNNRRVTDGEAGMAAGSLIGAHAEVMRRSAEVTASVASAFQDGTVTPAEAQQIDRTAAHLEAGLRDLRGSLAGAQAGDTVTSFRRPG